MTFILQFHKTKFPAITIAHRLPHQYFVVAALENYTVPTEFLS
jgi:hypothetical protein